MHWFQTNQPIAALSVSLAVLVACDAPTRSPEVVATTQALTLAPDGGFPELDVPTLKCSPDGTWPEEFALRTLENFDDQPGPVAPRQTLEQYTAECERIIGFKFDEFEDLSCEKGAEVPGQAKSCGSDLVFGCDTPNVLNEECDSGSKFQRLALKPTDDRNAAAVMHCRKQKGGNFEYEDIAIIMSNKQNGATCFFQALSHKGGPGWYPSEGAGVPDPGMLDGRKIASPKKGASAWRWLEPWDTARRGCQGCHDSGPFIRSPYIAQMPDMPNDHDGWANAPSPDRNGVQRPLKWVGEAFADKHSWSVHLANPPCLDGTTGPSCLTCTSCHALAVNDYNKDFISPDMTAAVIPRIGSALDLGVRATARQQYSKHTHSASSPIWMPPNHTTFDPQSHQAALAFANCAAEFLAERFGSGRMSPGCSVTELGGPWVEPQR